MKRGEPQGLLARQFRLLDVLVSSVPVVYTMIKDNFRRNRSTWLIIPNHSLWTVMSQQQELEIVAHTHP